MFLENLIQAQIPSVEDLAYNMMEVKQKALILSVLIKIRSFLYIL